MHDSIPSFKNNWPSPLPPTKPHILLLKLPAATVPLTLQPIYPSAPQPLQLFRTSYVSIHCIHGRPQQFRVASGPPPILLLNNDLSLRYWNPPRPSH
ncbi:hypothetical protein BJ508DRAFT_121319 [Ascobolus immersus RN42]|uniref:Uncharacterized protein n=1 Tax=Ascobolus immersus RN42 TaxID=1160509 RepID=A0A3N4IL46_ASCIM|nr:hypothetical protein BJ508DRAFT_121319 [Ascobolus immersus RN42]